MPVEFLVFFKVGADVGEEDDVVKALRHLRIEVGCKYPRRRSHGLRTPVVRLCEIQYLLPIRKRGHKLEGLR